MNRIQLVVSGPSKPGRVSIVLPAGFAVNPPEDIDDEKAEKIRKWKWVQFDEMFFAIPNIALLQGRKSAGFCPLPKETIQRFGILMEGGYNYLVHDVLTNTVSADKCFIGVSELACEYNLLVPAGWAKIVLWLVKERIVRVDKGHLQPDFGNFIVYCEDNSWRLMGKGEGE